tara:strand:+ start:802 stop:963 length:162 start_codon:yes stop_codon:yes gene_type:complete
VIAGASHSKWVQIERNESQRLKGVLKNKKDEMKYGAGCKKEGAELGVDILAQH